MAQALRDGRPNTASNARHRFAYDDLREWLAEADRLGELETVSGASWEQDIGLATTLVKYTDGTPALLFDDIPGFPKGLRVLLDGVVFSGGEPTLQRGLATAMAEARDLGMQVGLCIPVGPNRRRWSGWRATWRCWACAAMRCRRSGPRAAPIRALSPRRARRLRSRRLWPTPSMLHRPRRLSGADWFPVPKSRSLVLFGRRPLTRSRTAVES
jgi:hypothetical protein